MAQNEVQYQRGLSIPEFFDGYGSQEQCEVLVRGWRWPEGFICPRCQGSWHSEFRRQGRLYFQCSGCRYQCSLVSGTVLESSKLPLPTWFLAMHLMTQAKNNGNRPTMAVVDGGPVQMSTSGRSKPNPTRQV